MKTASSAAEPAFARRLDPAGSLPLYQQMQRAVREAIARAALAPDDALPSERQLAEHFAVSRITVRRAIEGLVAEGLLVSRQGCGTFVRSRVEKNFAKLTSFSEEMRARGSRPHSVWLRKSIGRVTPEEALKLALSPGTQVMRFHRLRFADDAPMAIESATIVASALPSLDAVGESLYDALAAHGNRPARALQRLRALLLSPDRATLLHANAGDAGLMVERLGYLRDGRAIELSQSIYRADTYEVIAELSESP
jgi:GntR family transcriptional regulator